MKKKMVLLIMLCFSFFLFGCDEDFAPYSDNTYTISVPINGDIYTISDIEEEINNIVKDYVDNTELAYSEYYFYNTPADYAMFNYVKYYEKSGVGYTISIDIYVDINKKIAYKIQVVDGISKRVPSNTGASDYIKYKEVNAYDLYKVCKDGCTQETTYIVLAYREDGINICYFDKDNYVIRKELYSK